MWKQMAGRSGSEPPRAHLWLDAPSGIPVKFAPLFSGPGSAAECSLIPRQPPDVRQLETRWPIDGYILPDRRDLGWRAAMRFGLRDILFLGLALGGAGTLAAGLLRP